MNQDSQAEPRVYHFDDADYPSVPPIEPHSGRLTDKEFEEWKKDVDTMRSPEEEDAAPGTLWRVSAESIRRHCLATATQHATHSLEDLVTSLEFYELFDQGLADRRKSLIEDLRAFIDELEKQERTRR